MPTRDDSAEVSTPAAPAESLTGEKSLATLAQLR